MGSDELLLLQAQQPATEHLSAQAATISAHTESQYSAASAASQHHGGEQLNRERPAIQITFIRGMGDVFYLKQCFTEPGLVG